MAYTKTVTATRTYPRLELLKVQIKIALRRALGPEDLSVSAHGSIMKGVQNEWIEWIHVFGFDQLDQARCLLTLHIDWYKYQAHISAGRTTVEIDDRWPDETAIELHEVLELFNDFAHNNGLRTEWRVAYRPSLDRDEINRILGFQRAAPVSWAGNREGIKNVIPELDETTVEFWIVS